MGRQSPVKGHVNELTGVRTAFGHDEFSNLVWSNEGGQFDFIHRSVDDVGNLYETKDKKDRVYGAGSRLLETADATFSYDEEGNLVQKVERNSGATWQYEYTGNGMLARVIKPDQTAVTFKYDALGRRVEKHSSEKTTTFIWDGNTIFHEYFSVGYSEKSENLPENSTQSNPERPENLITWVFNDGFVPSAKLTSEGHYSIISDYLGTPVEAYDEQGQKVWSAALDIYGRVHEFTGEQDFIPFRYQGQYEDIEIGLYYNRFRYYDPAQGNYTQVDPIGLAGGNPTLYGYVSDLNRQVDIFGLYNGEGVRALGAYHTFHSHLLKSSEYTETDAYHFSKANESLNKAFQNDPEFKAKMEKKYPNISKHVAVTRLGTYRGTAPKGTTWHHATASQVDGQKGWLQLVDRKDHSKYHKIYHPDDIGGRNEWGGGTACRKK